jgi:hypothetical protein
MNMKEAIPPITYSCRLDPFAPLLLLLDPFAPLLLLGGLMTDSGASIVDRQP